MPSDISCSILSTKTDEFEVEYNFASFSMRPVFDILSKRQIFIRESSFSSTKFDEDSENCLSTNE